MADSRRIIPPAAGNRPGASAQHDEIPRTVLSAALTLRTDRAIIDGSDTDPSVVAVGSTRRREATLYSPATDPVTATANTATVWLIGADGDWRRSFPLIPGATLTVDLAGWIYGYTTTADTPTVYVLDLED